MNRNFNSHAFEYEFFKNIKPALAYDGAENFSEWQNRARAKLNELLGLPFEKCDPMFEIEYVKEYDAHKEYRFSVQTEKGYFVPCYLLVPNSESTKIPLTVCLSGHGAGMHIALGRPKTEKDEEKLVRWPHRAMAPRSVKEGRAALVIEARNFGESSLEGYGTSCTEAAKIAILSGRTVIGERVWDAMRILDSVLEKFDFIDEEGIVCTGNSGGGTATYYLACCDDRIAIAAPSCSICSYETSVAAMPHCMCNHVPSIRKFFEMGDLAGLIAPRKLVIAAGKLDEIFPAEGTEKTFLVIKNLYEHAGCSNHCALVWGDGGHFNYADELWTKIHEFEREN